MVDALLLVMMEPPSALEDEFNDWYDTEHFPQRRALPGFETASRWVCLAGFPRWLALYDLTTVDALATEDYLAVSGANSTPWSRRVLPRTIGRERIVCRRAEPGTDPTRPATETARLVAARYSGTSADRDRAALRGRVEGLPGLIQLRVFETVGPAPDRRAAGGGTTTWVLAAFDRPAAPDRLTEAFATLGEAGARLVNVYAPYLREGGP